MWSPRRGERGRVPLTGLVCTGGGADTTVDIPGGVATIGFDAGETIVCTFTNTQQGSVTVVKDTVPNGPGGLRVHGATTGRPRPAFSLDDDADATLSNTQLLTGVVDGQTYVVTETTANAAGFTLTDLVCTGGGADTTVDVPGGVATIGFDAGEDDRVHLHQHPAGFGVGGQGHGAERPGGLRVHRRQRGDPGGASRSMTTPTRRCRTPRLLTGVVDGQTYVVTETSANAAGFSLTDLVCIGGGADTTVDIPRWGGDDRVRRG